MVYHAEEARISKSKIEDEITVIPEFRDIFTDKYSLIGRKGRSIL